MAGTVKKAPAKQGTAKPVKTTVGIGKSPAPASGASKKKTSFLNTVLDKVAKIDSLPKTVTDTIPFRGIMNDGIIETKQGVFTKSYKLPDVNFTIAPEDEQLQIFKNYMQFLNGFDDMTKWQLTIFNHEIDKRATFSDIRISPQRDGLNKYRQEMNQILLNNLKKGGNSIRQDKYLTISIEDSNADHAVSVLRRNDSDVSAKLKKIIKKDIKPMTSLERMHLLYDIYNMNSDYRFATGIYNGKADFSLEQINKLGKSVKDVIGPEAFDFRPKDHFKLGDVYAQVLYLEKVPTELTTNYISDLSDIQSNMLISMTMEKINSVRALKMVRGQLANVEGLIADKEHKNAENGYFGALPPELEAAQKNARELMEDITGRNQNLFFMTFVVVVFANSKKQLDDTVALVKRTAEKHMAPLKNLIGEQEQGLNTALPLCRNDLRLENLYTTESASVFIPFKSQELNQKNAIFYGLNQLTKSMLLYDRMSGSNYNGLIFGTSGSGKSFTAKEEIANVLLNKPKAQVFVIDPQGEYAPMTSGFNGQEIILSPSSPKAYMNPLDLDISEDSEEEDPIAMKVDFVFTFFKMINKGAPLDPICNTIVDRATRKIYTPYVESLKMRNIQRDIDQCPTLSDLYQELLLLKAEFGETAGYLASIIAPYAVGSFSTFAHRTNINTDSRFIVYNTKTLGNGMKDIGLYICINDVLNRMMENFKNGIDTWFYIDEFHVLLESPDTTAFLKRIWKMVRKWHGVPTGIMQNTEDILGTKDGRAILNNTSFVIMLKSTMIDRNNFGELYNLSASQLEYLTDSDPGHGLMYNGKVCIPFGLKFPHNTKLYDIMQTSNIVA